MKKILKTKQWTIYEPIKTVRATIIEAPASMDKEEVYEHYNEGITDVEIIDTTVLIEDEEVYDEPNVELNN